jgi:Mg2+/Co2+ transporter CorB
VNALSNEFLFGLLALCCFMSAFFSGTETALMSINRYQLRTLAKQGNRRAMVAEKLLERPDKLIGLILLGNNLVNNLAATLVAVLVLRLANDEWLAVGAAALTLVMLVFCEVGPKTYGALHPRAAALYSAPIYRVLQWVAYPAVWIVNRITNAALRVVGVKADQQTQQTALTQEELRTVVAEAGVMIPQRHQQMLMGILDLERVTVDDIMIPRSEVSGIDLDDDWGVILETLRDSQHTRLPVYEGELDKLVGVLHMKRIANELARGKLTREMLREIATQRGAMFVPEGTPLNKALVNFQREKRRFAFVVDEYGDIQGLITLEDLLEEIVGEFTSDPSAAAHKDVHEESPGVYVVNGSITVRKLNRALGWKLPIDGPKTLNGLILEQLENIPQPGTALRIERHVFEVLQTADNTIRTVRVTTAPETPAADADELRD